MSRHQCLVCWLLCIGTTWAGSAKDKSIANKANGSLNPKTVELTVASVAKPHLDYTQAPLNFEPNVGQTNSAAHFIARSHYYNLSLESTGVSLEFHGAKEQQAVRMDLEGASNKAAITAESPLAMKANYFPTGDRKTWITNVPTYSRVHYSDVYSGVDVTFYGTASRLEYDFLLEPHADSKLIRMKMSGADAPALNSAGDLVLSGARFLKPLAYQVTSDGKTREIVTAAYHISKDAGEGRVVTFELGQYDHARRLIIDPVVDSLSYSEYINQYYVGAVAVDASGNSYVAGSAYPNNVAFYVNKFGATGVQLYSAVFGTASYGNAYPYALAIDSSGQAYVTGQVQTAYATVPSTTNAYQTTPGSANVEAFLAVLSADGSALPYCTYLSGGDNQQSISVGVALDTSAKVYIGGETSSASFPTTTGAYQSSNSAGFQTGWLAKFDPTKSGTASLIYSTLLGSTSNSGTQVNRVAVDYAGNAYVAVQAPQNYPVTPGSVKYIGLYSTSGGAYVTKVNSTGTGLVYSAYLGYGGASGIAVDAATSGSPSAYVSGWINSSGQDFPTTAGAYQTSYASGFAVKLSGDGTSEIYSTFLSGPSGDNGGAVDQYPILAIPIGCASACNAYITGRTNSSDFPTINPIQTAPAEIPYSAFIVELNSTGTSALFSSYLSGYAAEVYRAQDSASYGITPAISVDSSGNMYVVGNTTGSSSSSDFPTTIPYPSGSYEAFLAKISVTATAGFTLTQPATINLGNQPVGVTSAISTVRLSNFSSAAVTGLSVQAAPNVFSESDNCNGVIAPGGTCSLEVTFTPNSPAARSGALTITSSAGNSPITVALTGTAYDTGYIEASPTGLTFSSQTAGTTSAAQSFTITNVGDASTSVSTNTQSGNFAALNNCPPQLAAGASCMASVTFSPTQPGLYTTNLYIGTSYGPALNVPLTGTGTVAGATSVLTPSAISLQFGNQLANSTSGVETLYVTNTGTEPLTVSSVVASGNFNVTYYSCGAAPSVVNPQQACQINVTFSPTTAGTLTGQLTITNSGTGSPTTVALSGTGLATTQTVEFNPSTSVSFPDTPQGTISGYQTIYLQNTGSSPLTVYRTVVSSGFKMTYSSCEAATVNGTVPDGLGSTGYCQVNVEFTPSATASGSQTGTLTFIDSAPGSPHVVNLLGNAITATGTINAAPSEITFSSEPQGVSSTYQLLYVENPGNTPVTVTAATFGGTNATDFSTTGSNCGALPFTMAAGQTNCYFYIYFTPGGTGSRTATFTFASSAGNSSATVLGTGLAATQAVGLTPTSLNLGSIVEGTSGNYEGIYLRNSGTETVTFSANPAFTGPNAGDFNLEAGCANNGQTLAANGICNLGVRFSPSTTGSESATLTFTDSAGTQTFALSGTGVTVKPTYTTEYHAFSYPSQLEGTTSPNNYYTYFYNNGTTPVTLGNASVTGPFLIPHGNDNCSGQNIGAGSSCYLYVQFAPTTTGYLTGTLTFNNASGSPLTGAPVLALAGFSITPTYSAYVNPTADRFVNFQVIGTTSSYISTYLYNSGNTAFTVGTVNGTDLGLASSTAEFSIYNANGGYNGCSGSTVQPGSYCYVNVTFTPNAAGTRTGTINFPVTYANSSTATIIGNLTGSGVAERNSAVLTPPNGAFLDQVVGTTTTYNVTAYLNNNGNQPFTVASLSNSNSSEFSTAASVGGYDSCSGATVQIGSSCQINVRFTPSASGSRTGSITFPVTFADKTTANPTLPLSGIGITSAKTIAITPSKIQFTTEIQSVTSGALSFAVVNTGNSPVTIGTDSITTNAAEFEISYDNCKGGSIGVKQSCSISVTFTPSGSATGAQTGVLTISDNATGGPHTVNLTGTAITAAQQVTVSQTTLAFGNQPAGSTSNIQSVYFTNQGDSNLTVTGMALGGTNAADFKITYNNCGGTFYAHNTCYINVEFVPPTGTTGAVTATITETDSGSPGTHTLTLTGTSVTPGPALAFDPATLTFPNKTWAAPARLRTSA